ncbi:MAG: hypothetical protein ACRC6X_04645 [Culicoidibacterales bacterium]
MMVLVEQLIFRMFKNGKRTFVLIGQSLLLLIVILNVNIDGVYAKKKVEMMKTMPNSQVSLYEANYMEASAGNIRDNEKQEQILAFKNYLTNNQVEYTSTESLYVKMKDINIHDIDIQYSKENAENMKNSEYLQGTVIDNISALSFLDVSEKDIDVIAMHQKNEYPVFLGEDYKKTFKKGDKIDASVMNQSGKELEKILVVKGFIPQTKFYPITTSVETQTPFLSNYLVMVGDADFLDKMHEKFTFFVDADFRNQLENKLEHTKNFNLLNLSLESELFVLQIENQLTYTQSMNMLVLVCYLLFVIIYILQYNDIEKKGNVVYMLCGAPPFFVATLIGVEFFLINVLVYILFVLLQFLGLGKSVAEIINIWLSINAGCLVLLFSITAIQMKKTNLLNTLRNK